ncbi:hypothetical protein C8R43DRAFT_946775 [Mycena crocata]|nr:hypothetical protein C8R43DRAFT_946775 [Mycena crocata]
MDSSGPGPLRLLVLLLVCTAFGLYLCLMLCSDMSDLRLVRRNCYILSQREDRKPCGGPDRPEIGRSPEARTRPEVKGRLFSQTPQLRRVCDCLTVKPGQEWKGSTIRRAAGGGPEKRGKRMIRIDRSSSEAKTKSVKDVRRSKVQPQSRVKDKGKSE